MYSLFFLVVGSNAAAMSEEAPTDIATSDNTRNKKKEIGYHSVTISISSNARNKLTAGLMRSATGGKTKRLITTLCTILDLHGKRDNSDDLAFRLSQELVAWGKAIVLAVCECCQYEILPSVLLSKHYFQPLCRDFVHYLLFM